MSSLRACTVLVLVLLAGGAPARAQQPTVAAVLDLTLNTQPKGEIHVLLEDREVWADAAALEAAGLRQMGAARLQARGREYVRLSSIVPAVGVRMDEAALTLTLTADPSLFASTVLRFDTGRPADIVYTRAPSAFVNYGLAWAGGAGGSVSLETGVSLGRALATTNLFIAQAGRASRGLSSVTFDNRARLTRIVVGDTIVATGPLGGSLQIAGASVSRDFTLDPYFIRYSTTALSGVVTTPSRVELYVNNQLVRVAQVQPGAYELANLVLPSGAGDTRVVVRDAFGGQQEYGGSYYMSTTVLARGLQQFQYAAGAERLRPFDTMWNYGHAVVTGTHRIGLTDAITLGGRIEVEPGLGSGGPAVAARLGRFGAVELTAAASRNAGRGGLAGGMAYEYSGRTAGLALAWRSAGDGYATLTTRRSRLAPQREFLTSASLRASRRVTITSGWQAIDYQAAAIRRASASSTITLRPRVSLYLTAARSRVEGRWQTGVFASLTYGFRSRAAASLSAESQDGVSRVLADVQQSAPLGPGIGYHVQATGAGAGAALLDGELRAQARWGQIDIRQSTTEGHTSTSLQANGALVAIGGRVLATRPVQDGFALVRVPGVPGVRAFVSQQEMGRTDGHGDLLVPNLLSYYGNQVSIADADVPIDRTLAANRMVLAPPFRGGAIAEFVAARDWRAQGTIAVMGDAAALIGQRAIDATLVVDGAGRRVETTLGLNGEFYIEGLAPGRHVATVRYAGGECAAVLDVPASSAPVILLGIVTCVPAATEPPP